MKRIRLWAKELSLSQQLISIIFMITVSFMIFFFVFLTNSVDNFVKTEMYKVLHRSQSNVKLYLENNFDNIQSAQDTNIIHVLYDLDNRTCTILNPNTISNDLITQISSKVELATTYSQDFTFVDADNEILYSIIAIDNHKVLASIMNNTYKLEFKNAITNSFINVNMGFISIVFMVLMLWVSSLIHPLNQIRNYVNHIKNDENATLVINRKDEIGDLANALVDMKDQLDKENRIKEEMVQNISHDLKTPIATIKSYSESIKDGIYPYDTLEKSVDVIIEHADRLEKKVYQLIVLNKMGYLLDNCEPGLNLNMKNVIEKVIISLKVVRPEIELITNLNDVYFHGEEEPWRIVVENLIDNALRYAICYVKIDLNNNELTVENDGKQIEADRLDKLFKPYEKGTDGKFGLGLSIVQRVTSTYGYKVSAENLTNGVCFRIINSKTYYYKQDEQEVNDASIVQIEKKKKRKEA